MGIVSESNHHRIIIGNSNGTILDSFPLSFYHADEDCLYIVDSEILSTADLLFPILLDSINSLIHTPLISYQVSINRSATC